MSYFSSTDVPGAQHFTQFVCATPSPAQKSVHPKYAKGIADLKKS